MYTAAKGSICIIANSAVFLGLYLTTSEPLDPLVREYFVRQGAAIVQGDDYIILHGPYTIPSEKELFAAIEALSMEIHGEIAYILEPHTSRWGDISHRVISTKPIPESKITKMKRVILTQEETKILHDLARQYFESKGATVEIDANKAIHVTGGSFPKNERIKYNEMKEFIAKHLEQIPEFTFECYWDLENIIYHTSATKKQTIMENKDESESIFSYYNPFTWIFGNKTITPAIEEEQDISPKLTPKP